MIATAKEQPLKALRNSYLTVVAQHMIVAEDYKAGVNDDRIPPDGMRIKILPGEDLIVRGEDAEEFRRQIDEVFPRPPQSPPKRTVIQGQPVDPETGDPLIIPAETKRQG